MRCISLEGTGIINDGSRVATRDKGQGTSDTSDQKDDTRVEESHRGRCDAWLRVRACAVNNGRKHATGVSQRISKLLVPVSKCKVMSDQNGRVRTRLRYTELNGHNTYSI